MDCLFQRGKCKKIVELYADNAVNHQVANDPIIGKTAIYEMFENEFATAKMVCIVENMFEDGEWAIMEWKDPLGLRIRSIGNCRSILSRYFYDWVWVYRRLTDFNSKTKR